MPLSFTSLQSKRGKGVLIVTLVFALAVLTWVIPPRAQVLHNILHHLNILPFMLAGLFFGWRAALQTLLLGAVLQTPSIYRHWSTERLDAEDQLVELGTFGTAGVIAGVLAERERTQRTRVEATKRELEQVYIELRQSIDQLRRTERLTAAGKLSASLAHEIRNPLASISGAAGILARGNASQESRAECLDILTKESQRLNKLLTNFLQFARPRLPRLQSTEADEMVQSVTRLAQHAGTERGVALRIESDTATIIACDGEQIKQLLLNLVLNAVQASPAGSEVTVRSRAEERGLCIEVLDRGHGIANEDAEHIFEPFFTTRESGTGLGLAIAANIAAQHGGALTCAANGGQGTVFRLELPYERTRSEARQGMALR